MATVTPAHLHGLAAVLGALGAGSRRASARPPVEQAGGIGRISWGGQTFQNPADLVAWMNARGQNTSVAQFLGRHPGVAAQYGQRQATPGGGAVGTMPGSGVTQGGSYLNPGAPPQSSAGPPGLLGPPVGSLLPPPLSARRRQSRQPLMAALLNR